MEKEIKIVLHRLEADEDHVTGRLEMQLDNTHSFSCETMELALPKLYKKAVQRFSCCLPAKEYKIVPMVIAGDTYSPRIAGSKSGNMLFTQPVPWEQLASLQIMLTRKIENHYEADVDDKPYERFKRLYKRLAQNHYDVILVIDESQLEIINYSYKQYQKEVDINDDWDWEEDDE